MKKLLLIFVLSACASKPPEKGYFNILSDKNEILAQVNQDTNSVRFFEAADRTVLQLLSIINKLSPPKAEAPKKVELRK